MLEPTTPTPPTRRPRRAVVVGVSLLGLATAAVAVTAGTGDGPGRLSLVSSGTVSGAESTRSAAPASAPYAADEGERAAGDSAKMSSFPVWDPPRYEVEGVLPELGGEGRAWRLRAPELDRARAARMAAAVGLAGTLVARDGGWVVESPAGSFIAYPGDESWSVNFSRNDVTAGPAVPAAPGRISAADAEAGARQALEAMGVLDGDWKVEVNETEMGVGYACEVPPAPASPPFPLDSPDEEMARLEAEKLASIGQGVTSTTSVSSPAGSGSSDSGSSGSTPVDRAFPDVAASPVTSDCPSPPPPVLGQHVTFFPVLDGMRADWNGWGVSVAPGGTIANLYGTWTRFEAAGSFPLRSVRSALEELRNPPEFVGDGGGRPIPMPAEVATTAIAVEPRHQPAPTMVDPAIMPAPEPCSPEVGCGPAPAPVQQVITITGVTRGLTATSVWTDGTVRTHLVPAYRFVGKAPAVWHTPEMSDRWETSVVALHPDAIAPPPAIEGESNVRKEG